MTKKRKKLIGRVICLVVQIGGMLVLASAADPKVFIGVMLMLIGRDMSQDVRRLK